MKFDHNRRHEIQAEAIRLCRDDWAAVLGGGETQTFAKWNQIAAFLEEVAGQIRRENSLQSSRAQCSKIKRDHPSRTNA